MTESKNNTGSKNNTKTIQEELLKYLFKEEESKRHLDVLPVLNYSNAVTVELGITLIKIKDVVSIIEIMNNTRAGIVIFFRSKKGSALLGGKFKFRIL